MTSFFMMNCNKVIVELFGSIVEMVVVPNTNGISIMRSLMFPHDNHKCVSYFTEFHRWLLDCQSTTIRWIHAAINRYHHRLLTFPIDHHIVAQHYSTLQLLHHNLIIVLIAYHRQMPYSVISSTHRIYSNWSPYSSLLPCTYSMLSHRKHASHHNWSSMPMNRSNGGRRLPIVTVTMIWSTEKYGTWTMPI